MEPTATSPAYPLNQPYYGAPAGNQSQTMSVGDWIVTMIISFIPLVGIIMLLVWAFGSNTPPSKANWAKALLIFSLVFMVLGFLFASSLAAFFMHAGSRGGYN